MSDYTRILLWVFTTGIFAFFTGIWFNITPDYKPTEEEKKLDNKVSRGIGIFWIVWFVGGIIYLMRGIK
jgi:hypothetical protein